MVHNVSHADMLVSLGGQPTARTNLLLARPHFSTFTRMADLLEESVCDHQGFADDDEHSGSTLRITSFPLFTRSTSSSRYPIVSPSPGRHLPVGFAFAPGRCPALSQRDMCENLKLRREDKKGIAESSNITGVYFPLLAVLIPKWTRWIRESQGDPQCEQTVFLVSGVGTPRNSTHELAGNSTEGVTRLMEMWLNIAFPRVKVVRVHSQTNIFRYDENISFVKHELLPKIEAMRDHLAERFSDRWRDLLRVTISFADGTTARISAIHHSLRPYQPVFMHVWQLKTFWHECKVCEDDIELLAFEDVTTLPAVPANRTEEDIRLVVDEMHSLKLKFATFLLSGAQHDMAQFWHRKTRKVVLAVLLVRKSGDDGQASKLYHGTNMEVSVEHTCHTCDACDSAWRVFVCTAGVNADRFVMCRTQRNWHSACRRFWVASHASSHDRRSRSRSRRGARGAQIYSSPHNSARTARP